MERLIPRPRVTIGGVPLHAMLVPFPISCFTGALITDVIYYNSAQIQWANFSAWLLAFGLVMGGLATLFGMIDFFGTRQPKPIGGWFHMGGNLLLLFLALVNSFVHARDGWTSVVPTGLVLSAVTVFIMVLTGFLGHRMVYSRVRSARS